MALDKKSTYKKDLIICLIGVLLEFGFGPLVGEFHGVTQVGSNVIGVFLGVILMTVTTSQTFFASVSGILAMIWGGYLTADSAITGWLGSNSVAGVIFIGSLSVALQKSGLMDIFVKKFVSIPAFQHKPKLFLYALLIMDYFVAMFIGFIPMVILAFSMFESIRDMVGYEPKSATSRFILLGIYSSCMGSFALPFKGVTLTINTMADNTMKTFGLRMSPLHFWITSVAVYVVYLLVYVFLLEPLFKCDLKPLRDLEASKIEAIQKIPDKMNARQHAIFWGFLIGVVYLIICNVVDTKNPFWGKFCFMGGFLGFLCILAILQLFRIDGEPIVNATKSMAEGAMWGTLVIVGCFTYLGNAMAAKDLGVRAFIMDLLKPLFGNMGLIPLCLICCIVVVFATNFCNGLPLVLAAYSGVLPFVCELSLKNGVNASVVAAMINLAANMAFLTYAGTIYASLLLNRPEIDQKWVWSKGIKAVPVYVICLFGVSMILAYILPQTMAV